MDYDPNERYSWVDELVTDICLGLLFIPIIIVLFHYFSGY